MSFYYIHMYTEKDTQIVKYKLTWIYSKSLLILLNIGYGRLKEKNITDYNISTRPAP